MLRACFIRFLAEKGQIARRWGLRLTLTAAALALLLAPMRARAADPTIQPLAPDGSTYYGMTLADWAGAWLEWWYSIPQSVSPDFGLDTAGVRSGVGQHGPVWFLPGWISGWHGYDAKMTRHETIPSGKAILAPLGFYLRAYPAGLHPDEDLLSIGDVPSGASGIPDLILDGVPMPDPPMYEITTPVVGVLLPPGNVFSAPVTAGQDHRAALAAKGVWMLLPPLPDGEHVLQFGGVTEDLTIQDPNAPLP